MGKNKDRLQANNLDLSAILSSIQNLPPAGGEDLQSTAEAQTTAVTELLKMVSRKVADHKGEGEYVWKKLTAEGGEFIDFVVSNDAEAYPNGAVHTNGYWYELVEEGVDLLSILGYTRIAVDNFVVSTDTSSAQSVNHSLGEIPKFALLLTKHPVKDFTRYYVVMTFILNDADRFANNGTYSRAYGFSNNGTGSNIVNSYSDITTKVETFTATSIGISYLNVGIEYTLITMA